MITFLLSVHIGNEEIGCRKFLVQYVLGGIAFLILVVILTVLYAVFFGDVNGAP